MMKFGEFELTSGKISPYYIDLRLLITFPSLMKQIAELAIEQITDFDIVAGVATGGIPFSSFISAMGEIPGAYVRKKEKTHGASNVVEGRIKEKTVLLVDDVTTTGGSLFHGVTQIRENGGRIHDALVIVNREEGAATTLEEVSVNLHSILTVSEMIMILNTEGLLGQEEYQAVKTYLNNQKKTKKTGNS